MSVADVLAGRRQWHVEACDVLDGLAALPAGSVHCVVTSPPYWALRDYGTATWEGGDPGCDHKATRIASPKMAGVPIIPVNRGDCARCGAVRVDRQIGLEPTVDAFVAAMVEVFAEVRRVLRKDGTCWVNLGDSYATNPGNGRGGEGVRRGSPLTGAAPHRSGRDRRYAGDLKPKDLVGVPWRVAFALQADGWYLRSAITWCKRAAMPESVTDRPTSATEMVFLLSRSPKYYYDQTAVAEPSSTEAGPSWEERRASGADLKGTLAGGQRSLHGEYGGAINGKLGDGASRNLRNFWLLSPEPYADAHFATFPTEIPRRAILAGTSAHGVCPACGAPWRRRTKPTPEYAKRLEEAKTWGRWYGKSEADMHEQTNERGTTYVGKHGKPYQSSTTPDYVTTGWSPGCACDAGAPVPAVCLDPFAGSGTTLMVALRHGRRALGFDLNPGYVRLARDRIVLDAPMFNGMQEAGG